MRRIYSQLYHLCPWRYAGAKPEPVHRIPIRKEYTIKGNSNGRAYVNILVGNTYLARKELWVGAPIISGITRNGSTLTAETLGGDANINRTEWKIGSNIFTSSSKSISSHTIRRILLAFPKVRPEWLAWGTGGMRPPAPHFTFSCFPTVAKYSSLFYL